MIDESNTDLVLGPGGHKYAMELSKPPPGLMLQISTKRRKLNHSTPGQIVKNLGGGVSRITNDPNLIEKGYPATEYKSSFGWTTMNNPLANRFPPTDFEPALKHKRANPEPYIEQEPLAAEDDELDLYDDYDEEDEADDEASPDEEIETEIVPISNPKARTKIDNRLVLTADSQFGSIDGLNLSAVLNRDKAKFSVVQEKEFCRWMLKHKTYQVGGLKTEFDALLKSLGFTNEKLEPELLHILRIKVRGRLSSLKDAIVKTRSATDGEDEDGKPELVFALWTKAWEEDDWDGDFTGPKGFVQKAFEGNLN